MGARARLSFKCFIYFNFFVLRSKADSGCGNAQKLSRQRSYNEKMKTYVGTSGFSYHHWAEIFYPHDVRRSDWLEYYAKHFNSVEINSSFYRLPQEKTFENWRGKTPEGFVFSIKGSRFITHTKRLLIQQDSVDLFMQRAKGLDEKLKVILWQFPPSFKSQPDRLANFLRLLRHYDYRYAFEFRHESWFTGEVYEILTKYNAALVTADSPDFSKAEVQTADFSYIRFHGGKYLYKSNYSPDEMKEWSKKIEKLSKSGDVFAYFNNDANAFAAKNAIELKRLLGK